MAPGGAVRNEINRILQRMGRTGRGRGVEYSWNQHKKALAMFTDCLTRGKAGTEKGKSPRIKWYIYIGTAELSLTRKRK